MLMIIIPERVDLHFDPAKPINNSKNNTGIKELPPVSPPFIWYPYGNSPDFPQMGTGGRTAMAGPDLLFRSLSW